MLTENGKGRASAVLDLDRLLAYAVERGASDVHIKVGSPPFIRIDGRLERIDHAAVSPVETERIAFAIMPKQQEFLAKSDADFAYSVAGLGRFRVNVMRQRGSVGLVLRRVQSDIPSFEELGLPPVVRKLAEHERGLVLVTGPTGSGKTTTLGSMIDYINETQHKHIVTIEDPIEILHADKASIVNQREVGTDTVDFHAALKRVLRQDPDVILVGEMRHRDGEDRAHRRRDRPPRVLDVAHHQRDRFDQPDHRLLPAARAAAGAHVARRVAAGSSASGSWSGAAAAASRRSRSSWRRVASSTRS